MTLHPVINGIQPMTAMKHIIDITALTQIVPLPKIIRKTVMLSTLPEQTGKAIMTIIIITSVPYAEIKQTLLLIAMTAE